MFRFLKPFSSKLWMVIAGTLLATGAAVYYMEWGNQFDFEPELKEAPNGTPLALVGLLKSTWLTCMRFTGSDGHDPDSWPGRWLVGFYFLVVMTITATYTAALANDFSDAVSVQTGVGDVTDFGAAYGRACSGTRRSGVGGVQPAGVKFVKLESTPHSFARWARAGAPGSSTRRPIPSRARCPTTRATTTLDGTRTRPIQAGSSAGSMRK